MTDDMQRDRGLLAEEYDVAAVNVKQLTMSIELCDHDVQKAMDVFCVKPDHLPYGKKARRALRGGKHE